jgi:Plasmid replication region DNA-binding N-term
MARSSTITYEDVAVVCRELASDGAKPTFKAVRARVGGSYEVLKRYISQWLEETAASVPSTLPQAILSDLNLIYQRLVIEASNEAQERLNEQVDLFAAERSLLVEQFQQAQLDMSCRLRKRGLNFWSPIIKSLKRKWPPLVPNAKVWRLN